MGDIINGVASEYEVLRQPKFYNNDTSSTTEIYKNRLYEYLSDGIELYETHDLNIDNIRTLDDVKRILKFMNIQAKTTKSTEPRGWSEVKDLFY